jgi:hypothetical protein
MSKQTTEQKRAARRATVKAAIQALVAETPANAETLMARTGASQAELRPIVDELVNVDKTHTMKAGLLAGVRGGKGQDKSASVQASSNAARMVAPSAAPTPQARGNGAGGPQVPVSTATGRKRSGGKTEGPTQEQVQADPPASQGEARQERREPMRAINELSAQELRERVADCTEAMESGSLSANVVESLGRIIRKYNKQLGKRA